METESFAFFTFSSPLRKKGTKAKQENRQANNFEKKNWPVEKRLCTITCLRWTWRASPKVRCQPWLSVGTPGHGYGGVEEGQTCLQRGSLFLGSDILQWGHFSWDRDEKMGKVSKGFDVSGSVCATSGCLLARCSWNR